jgi:hypothetical protein
LIESRLDITNSGFVLMKQPEIPAEPGFEVSSETLSLATRGTFAPLLSAAFCAAKRSARWRSPWAEAAPGTAATSVVAAASTTKPRAKCLFTKRSNETAAPWSRRITWGHAGVARRSVRRSSRGVG